MTEDNESRVMPSSATANLKPTAVAEVSTEPIVGATRDPQIVRVRGGDPEDADPKKRPTPPSALSRSILHVLKDFEWVDLESVGPKALSIVCEAFRLADLEVAKRRLIQKKTEAQERAREQKSQPGEASNRQTR